MTNKIVVGRWEVQALLINAICARIFLGFARSVAYDAGTAAWLETIFFSLLALLVFIITEKLYRPFAGRDILDVAEKAAGRFGSVFFGLVMLAVLLTIGSIILRQYAEDIKVVALPNTPIGFVMVVLLAAAWIGAYLGLEAILRYHALAVPAIILGLVIILVGVFPLFKAANLLPFFGNGIPVILLKGIAKTSTFAPMVYLLFLAPFLISHQQFQGSGYGGLMAAAVLLTLTAAVHMMVYGYPMVTENFLPIYQLARCINFGMFFQRIESVFLFSWVISALLYLSVILYFACYVVKRCFRLQYVRPLLVPVVIILFSLGFIPPNLMSVLRLDDLYGTFSGIFTLLLPLLIIIVARLRGAAAKE
ncbi:MAG TPA: GerAB/ArcD/ProY family transporter [Bacillota bacterium]|nr:GerAB/ArcD/ProY family transporter [Bacillota bacterium]